MTSRKTAAKETTIPFALLDMRLIIANAALHATFVICHLISNEWERKVQICALEFEI